MARRISSIRGAIIIILMMTAFILLDITLNTPENRDYGFNPVLGKLFNTEKLLGKQSRNRKDAKKWIVITTISYPTEAVKALATQKGWTVVVVADKKTPTDWNYPNCDFLSLDKQAKLDYAINDHVPFNSYTRKMIGYLYAIENGAEWIYDTDDDNQPIGKGLDQFDYEVNISGISYGNVPVDENRRNLFNPYNFYGQHGIWPRGFPLENLQQKNENHSSFTCRQSKAPIIQQGLVKKDPDVDAIYRLLHADKEDGLEVDFNEHAPPITLNQGTLCPFNSQNTLFHRDAFWALFLPVSVAFRVTDIWRSYFAQKLLHLTENRIGFYPTNAIQKRNMHSYLADLEDEVQLYSHAGRMVDYLTNWTCKSTSFSHCMTELSTDFASKNFWGPSDLELTQAWIKDLTSLNYNFPTIIKANSSIAKRVHRYGVDCHETSVIFSVNGKERIDFAREGYNDFKDWCLPASSYLDQHCFDDGIDFADDKWGHLQKVALVITSNYALGPSVSILQRLYSPYFAIVIFCGPVYFDRFYRKDNDSRNISGEFPSIHPFSYINMTDSDMSSGYRAFICPTKAIELRLQNVRGYMVIADDVAYNFWNEFDTSRARLSRMTYAKNGIWAKIPGVGEDAMNISIELIQNRTQLAPDSQLAKSFDAYSKSVGGDGFEIFHELLWSIADFYFVPGSCETLFYELASIFFEARLFHEIAVPTLIGVCGMDWKKMLAIRQSMKDLDITKFKHMWGDERLTWEKFYSTELIYLHPVKLSSVDKFVNRKKYCDGVLRSYAKAVARTPTTTGSPTSTSKTALEIRTSTTTTSGITITTTTSDKIAPTNTSELATVSSTVKQEDVAKTTAKT